MQSLSFSWQIDDELLQAALDNGSLLVVNSGSDLPVSSCNSCVVVLPLPLWVELFFLDASTCEKLVCRQQQGR
jgi:hypothetical protein